jgi:cell division septum initiation protein DivIVA
MTPESRTLGTFTPASAVPASSVAWSSSDDISQPPFTTVRRGYEPSAVDAHVGHLEDSIEALRSALEESERRRAMAEQHAVAVEEEIRVVRSGMATQPSSDTGFGARAERLLRLAETEAEQIRSTANRTAAEVTERALGDAERHRHEVRQRLITESARAEEYASRRSAELKEREGALSARLTGARAEAEAIRAAAERAADAHRATAKADVDELRNRVARELARARELEERELTRLRELQDATRRELTRLAVTIRAELPQQQARPSPGPGRGTSRGLGTDRGPGVEDEAVPQRVYAEVATAIP